MELNPILRIEYVSEGNISENEVSILCGHATDGNITIDLDDCEGVITPRLISASPQCLRTVRLFFPFSDPDSEKIYYSDAYITNECTKTGRLSDDGNVRSASLVLVKNEGDVGPCKARGIGFVTSVRFFAWFDLNSSGISVIYFMEDKELVQGQVYSLEKFIICSGMTPEDFLERLASKIRSENGERGPTGIPVGFCSWSRYYGNVNEEKILYNVRQMEKYIPEFANLVQIDDGWQLSGTFCGDWQCNTEKFPRGMAFVSDEVHSRNMKFGIWMAPFLLTKTSAAFDRLKGMARLDHEYLKGVYAFELDNPEYLDYLYNLFRRIKEECRCDYIKLDFLFGALGYHGETADGIYTYKSDYCIAVLRNALKTIRKAVGEEMLLLSCGSPILAAAGIFDFRRAATDIIWGKRKDFPDYWTIMQDAVGTVFHRYFYNKTGMINDADGLVVRDYDIGDGFDCTYSEARLWATAVAMSGGTVLVNDELGNLSPERRKLFLQQLPPLEVTGRPVDFFENRPTAVVAQKGKGTFFVALFHYGNGYGEMSFELSRIGISGKALVFDCYEGKYVGETDTVETGLMMPHSASLYMIKEVPDSPAFLYSTGNLFLGQNIHGSSFHNGVLNVTGKKIPREKMFAFFPEGIDVPCGDKTYISGGVIVKI
ncbi:MAG: alpha-galactosidase [Clostridia bacterium]|nr:alpha-galactosidase [Clostridia bacterium]